MSARPRTMLEPDTGNMIPVSGLPVTTLIKPCSVSLDAQAVSKYFTSIALASRSSKQLATRPTVPTAEDSPHKKDDTTSLKEPEAFAGDQEKDAVTVEEIVILDSLAKANTDEIIEISDSEDSVVEVETVVASKKKVSEPPPILVPNTNSETPPVSVPNINSETPPTAPKKTKVYEQVRYLCPKCKKHYLNKVAVSSHHAKAHNGSLRHSNIQQQVKKVYECLMCSVSFFNLNNFQIHCDSIHSVSIPVSELVSTTPVESGNDTLPVVSSKVDVPIQRENVPIEGESKDSHSTTPARVVKETCAATTTVDISSQTDLEDDAKTTSNPTDQPSDSITVEDVEVRHYCEKCDKVYSSVDELVLHNKKTHLRQRNSTPTYKAQVNLEAGKKETNKYECSECNRKFTSEADRNNHCKLDLHFSGQQKSDELRRCKYCHKYFKDVAQFFFHLGKEHASILDSRLYGVQDNATECTSPDAGVPEDNDSDVDIDSAVGSVSSSPDIIPQLNTESYSTKTPNEGRYHCDICKKNFAHKQSFHKHCSSYHKKSKQRYIVLANDGRDASGKFMCLICHKRFHSKNGASVHYGLVHDKPVASPKVQRYISTSSGLVKCIVCHKHFLSKKSAHDHYIQLHTFSDKPVAQVMPQMNDVSDPIEVSNPQNSTMKPSQSTTVPFETVFIESLDPAEIVQMKKTSKSVVNDPRNVMSYLSDKQTVEKFKCLNCCQQFDSNVALANHHCSELSHEISKLLQSEPSTVSVCQICSQDFMTDLQDIFCPTCKLVCGNETNDRPGTSNDRFEGESDFLDSKVDIVDHALHETSDTTFLQSQEEVGPTNSEILQSNTSNKSNRLLSSQAAMEPTTSKTPVSQLSSLILQCEKCCRMFMNKFAISKHVCKESNPLGYEDERIPCIYCEELCLNIGHAAAHRRQKHAYVCLMCKIDFKTEQGLEAHNNSQCHWKFLPYGCSFCTRKFKSVDECTRHIQRCHNISTFTSAMGLCRAVVNKPKILGNIFCPFCELKFKTNSILNYHFIKKHQMIQCLTCDNYFIFHHSSDTQCTKCNNLASVASNKEQRVECTSNLVNEQLEPTKKRKHEAVELKAKKDANEGCSRTRGFENWQARKKIKRFTVRESQENATEMTAVSNPPLIDSDILCNTCQNPIDNGDKCNLCSTIISQSLVSEQNNCSTCQNPIANGDKCNFCSPDISQSLVSEQNNCSTCQNPIANGDKCDSCNAVISQPLVIEPNICITCKNPITIGDRCNFCSPVIAQPFATEPNIPETNQNPVASGDNPDSFNSVKSVSNSCPTPVAMHRVIKVCTACGKLISSGDVCQFCSGNSSKSYDVTVSQSQDSPASKSLINSSSTSVHVPASNANIKIPSKSNMALSSQSSNVATSKPQSILAPNSYHVLNKCKTCGKIKVSLGQCLYCKPHLPCPPLAVPFPTTSGPSGSTNNPSGSSNSATQQSFKILGFQCSHCKIWVKGLMELTSHLKTVHNVNMKVSFNPVTNNPLGTQ